MAEKDNMPPAGDDGRAIMPPAGDDGRAIPAGDDGSGDGSNGKERGLTTGRLGPGKAGRGLRTGKLRSSAHPGGLRNADGTPVRRKLPRKKNNSGGGGVAVVGDDAGVHVKQLAEAIIESLFLKTKPLQQFTVYRGTENDAVKVYEGISFHSLGTAAGVSTNVVNTKEVITTSADIEVTGGGSIWAKWTVKFIQLSTSEASSSSSSTTLTVWRANAVEFVSYSFLVTASPPSPTYESADEWEPSAIQFGFWVEIAEVQLVNGYAGVVRQLQVGPVQIPNFTDAKITDTT